MADVPTTSEQVSDWKAINPTNLGHLRGGNTNLELQVWTGLGVNVERTHRL